MRSEALLLYFTLLPFAGAGFPEDSEPISISHGNYTKQYPVFVGHKPGRNTTQRHRLDIQMIMIMNGTLYIAARDHIYTVDIDTSHTEEIYCSKKLTWKSRQADVDTCRMKGKHKDECHNFIKVLLKKNDDALFVCGTNAFNPSCRNYKMDTLEPFGDEFSGMARCPYDAKHANVALFADGKLYSATVTDFLAIDAVIYRSLGESPTLRTVKHDSKWLKEPYFVQAVDYGDYIYFFFREIAVEYNTMGKVVFPRVAQVCKNDMGGSQRVLEKQWTSFLKARLNCSVPGDSHFYFNILQAVTDVIRINGRDVVLATFSTPYNSIPGSAVCAYDMLDIASVFTGRFKEQKSPDSTWTPVPDERVPKPRPGCCAGSSSLERYATSNEFPDDTLNFIKTHPLMDEAVPSIFNRPWFLRTMVRYRLTKIAVDTAAGPYQNHTVVFLGSEKGIILKFLARIGNSGFLNDSLFLEEMSVYNPEKCSYDGVEDKRIMGMQLDRASSSLYVAFSTCVIKVPLGRCERHGKCKKTCIASRDPYCGWIKEGGACTHLSPNSRLTFEQDIERGNTDGLGDCHNSFVALNGHSSSLLPSTTTSDSTAQEGYESRGGMLDWKHLLDSPDSTDPLGAVSSHNHQDKKGVIRESFLKGHDQLVPVTLLAIAVILAFVMGAVFSGITVYCVCDHRRKDVAVVQRKEKELSHSRRGSMSSVTKLGGLFGDTQSKDPKPEAILTPLMHNGKLATPGSTAKMLIKADQHHLDLTALPTPESTPTLQQKRKPSRGSREWERNQNLINACTKDLPPMGSPVIPTDLPLRASPGHIPSVVVLPITQQGYQHEYVEQPKGSEVAQMALEDQAATLEYKTIKEHLSSKSPGHGVNLVENLDSLPPKVPQREASLGPPGASLSQTGLSKRLEMHHSSSYGLDYKRSYPTNSLTRSHQATTLKRNNTNSSNSSHLSRNQSFGRGDNPPPAPQRVDSIQVHSSQPSGQAVTVSRQPSLNACNSLTRSGLKRTPSLKPDVPPKPSFAPLSTSMKPNDACT
ncbi:semaphorin-6A isoform X1 [Rhinopithecus roxellana]|uniref:Semaphorin-6A n=2 Tax=Rhinopithecus TaxID=542827 RepID=A0A2K6MZG4_RHIBE|nr:semaphorin-6A isoform X1 [Rhinopithecus roxellana]XP_017744492.1 PREDICTED: semaphorin-6A isoform X1 [Rhinopithecus bieti]XP_017744493.1 PREDICTED: semaphorin-6A isoform X1 [Rhinopithecus bieti]XP_017744494.1 PREDICTED: semaphorin-6A isoform X1 [Rhinopithecus bieti]XP_017744495.1 PREDICTED: semaphorin-6A isoform X1 [Rhinopithecus bieti]XP_017744496.1 PREDICTED: semaphorin-6A isoform X1 [Rhinopithecus bieti]XP_017744497.1 PREDICTED: semaphorin-6A isoform X1 [Rhinopithecus bieti]XP_01774449